MPQKDKDMSSRERKKYNRNDNKNSVYSTKHIRNVEKQLNNNVRKDKNQGKDKK